VRGMTSTKSVILLPSSPEPAPRRHRLGDGPATTTDAPTRARTSTPTTTVTPRRPSGGRRKTWPPQSCCFTATRRQRPLKRDECASSFRHCLKQRRRNKQRAPPRASGRSAVMRWCHQRMARTRLPPDIKTMEKGPGQRHQQSRASLGPTVMPGTPSRLADGLEVSTTTATTMTVATTTAHSTMATEGANCWYLLSLQNYYDG
jgi:hypothetical protein